MKGKEWGGRERVGCESGLRERERVGCERESGVGEREWGV